MNMFARFDENPAMTLQDIKAYINSHLELQSEITLIELAPSPYFFVLSILLEYMNMFARFDENPLLDRPVYGLYGKCSKISNTKK